MLLSNYAICGNKKSTFIKIEQLHNFNNIWINQFKLNKTINKFLLTGDRFMPDLHLKQPGLIYSACGPFTKHRERIQKFREIGNLQHLYRNELDKTCFSHDAAYSDSKDLAKRTNSDKVLNNKLVKLLEI